MNTFSRLSLVCALLALLSLGAGQWLASQSRLVQLVRPSAAASLFAQPAEKDTDQTADIGLSIGSPKQLIILDRSLFLDRVAASKNNKLTYYVNEVKMREKGVYPLQLKTLRLSQWLLVATTTILALVFGILSRRQQSQMP